MMHEGSRQQGAASEGLYYTAAGAHRPVVSTVAPERLRQIFADVQLGDWGSMSMLAWNIVQSQVDAHNASAKSRTRLLSLAEITAAMIPRWQPAEDLSKIPDHLWPNVPYPIFRRILKAKSSSGADLNDQIDNWVLAFEKQLVRTDFYSDWRFGLANLEDAEAMFPHSIVDHDVGARVITRPTTLNGFHVLGALRHDHVCIQPSATLFKRQFDRMTGGLLNGLNWNNIFVAGGIVLGALHAAHDQSLVTEEQWVSSDIDMYVYGLDPRTATEKIDHIFNVYKNNIPDSTQVLAVRNSKTVTFYSLYPTRRLQIVLKLVKSPKDVLLNFDLDICAMGWDGSDLWMLPRAARALETGFNVFTMDLIEGHYLSTRRASQEQRVFKYAYRGYGIRILNSYLSSLAESQQNLARIAHGEHLFPLNIDTLANAARQWTERVILSHQRRQNFRATPGQPFHCTPIFLENGDQKTSEPQGQSCLSGFSVFMRHVALWEMERREEVKIQQVEWAVAFYSEHSYLAYDDTPRYLWDEEFDLLDFEQLLASFNQMHITRWLPLHGQVGDVDFGESQDWIVVPQMLRTMKRVSFASEVEGVLIETGDIALPVLLPADFALHVNTLVEEAQRDAGFDPKDILTPLNTSLTMSDLDYADATLRLFVWSIPASLMWQQMDRRIDEVFEALHVFYHIQDWIYNRDSTQEDIEFEEPNWHMDAQKAIHKRLITQLSRRAHTVSSEEGKDEFAAFARWIGRKPISVDRFFRMDWDVESEYVDELDMLAPRPEHSSSNDSSMSENDEA